MAIDRLDQFRHAERPRDEPLPERRQPIGSSPQVDDVDLIEIACDRRSPLAESTRSFGPCQHAFSHLVSLARFINKAAFFPVVVVVASHADCAASGLFFWRRAGWLAGFA